MPLTALECKNAKPKERTYRLFDGHGLYLECTPQGGRYWRLKYRYDGKEKRLALGAYPEVPLSSDTVDAPGARQKRVAARKLLAQGIDPGAAKKAVKAVEKAQGETFELVAREWHKRFTPKWTPGHAARILISLEQDAFPWLGHRPMREILPPEVLAVARRVESRGAIETAHRLVGNIGMVFRYGVGSGFADSDPTASLRGVLSPTNEKHFPTITDPKLIGELLRAIDSYQGGYVVKSALRLLPYVFTRPGELRGMEWSELELDGPEPMWTIPPERMKARRKHLVPLCPQVVGILTEMCPLTGSERLVFPGQRSKERPISDATLGAALARLGYSRTEIVPHGFRALASTSLNEQGWNRDWIEMQLGHAERNAVRSAYNHAQYLPERRKMMLQWGNHLDALRVGGKVIPIGQGRAQGE